MNDHLDESRVAALTGLLGWLAALEDHAARLSQGEATVIVLDRQVTGLFQVGAARSLGPFLAYPGGWWWFPQAWAGVTLGPAGLALIAACPAPLAVLLPSDWPRTLAAVEQAARRDGWLALYPFAPAYWERLSQPARPRRALTVPAELDQAAGVSLDLIDRETVPWLNPLWRSPLPDSCPAIRP